MGQGNAPSTEGRCFTSLVSNACLSNFKNSVVLSRALKWAYYV
jgi:hypothetical protein